MKGFLDYNSLTYLDGKQFRLWAFNTVLTGINNSVEVLVLRELH